MGVVGGADDAKGSGSGVFEVELEGELGGLGACG